MNFPGAADEFVIGCTWICQKLHMHLSEAAYGFVRSIMQIGQKLNVGLLEA